MIEYGNDAIAVPLLLELIDFDRVQLPHGSGGGIYDADPTSLARHAAVRRYFAPLFEWTTLRGMRVFLDTDMLALTPPLSRQLRSLAPNSSVIGIDTSNPEVWEVYRAGLDELFDTVPSIAGVVIRFGEGGSLYNTDDWFARVGGMLAAGGAGLVTRTALLPDWVDVLRHLDRPLDIAPATETMLFALRTYAGVTLAMGTISWIVGTLLLVIGYGLCWRSVGTRRLTVGKGRIVRRV